MVEQVIIHIPDFKMRIREVNLIEVRDVLFHHDSAVILPSMPKGLSSEDGVETSQSTSIIDSIAVITDIYKFAEENPDKRLIITGHTDTTGKPKYNFEISMYRSCSVLYLLEGNKEKWAENSDKKNKVEDYQQILKHYSILWGWDCDPEEIDGIKGPKTERALRQFQERYNQEFGERIAVDGIIGKETWGAIFDCYIKELADMLSTSPEDLDEYRNKIQFVSDNHKILACGESYPIEEVKKDNYRSQTNRRVEVLFFDHDEEPKINCPDSIGSYNDKTCDLEKCPIYRPGAYSFNPVEINPHEVITLEFEPPTSTPIFVNAHCHLFSSEIVVVALSDALGLREKIEKDLSLKLIIGVLDIALDTDDLLGGVFPDDSGVSRILTAAKLIPYNAEHYLKKQSEFYTNYKNQIFTPLVMDVRYGMMLWLKPLNTTYSETDLGKRVKKQILKLLQEIAEKGDKLLDDFFDREIKTLEELVKRQKNNELTNLPAIRPFLAVDPRREGIFEKFKEKVNKEDGPFYGIKIYPLLGYLPTNRVLEDIFKICEEERIPVTTHCLPTGFNAFRPHWDAVANEEIKKLENEFKNINFNAFSPCGAYDPKEDKEETMYGEFLFNWDKVPEEDSESERLLKYLRRRWMIYWKKPQITKSVDGKIITIKGKNNKLTFELKEDGEEEKKVVLCIKTTDSEEKMEYKIDSLNNVYNDIKKRWLTILANCGSPYCWEKVLEKHPKLFLNFAHFGADEESWQNKIIELMKEYSNVYADISYNFISDSETTPENKRKALGTKINKEKIILDRLMFGDDFPMMLMESNGLELYETFLKNVKKDVFNNNDADFEKIISKNPKKFLGIE